MSVESWVKVKGKVIRHKSTWSVLSNASWVREEMRRREVRVTLKSLIMNGKDEGHSLVVINVRKVGGESLTETWEGFRSLIG